MTDLRTMALAAGVSLISMSAFAADAIDYVDPDPVAPAVEESRFSLTLGGGVGFQPLYEGSDEYRAYAFPIIAPSFGGEGQRRFDFRGLDDIRIHALYLGGLSLGPLVGYEFGRDESDSARLAGLGDIDGGLVVGGFVNYDVFDDGANRFAVAAALSTQVTGDAFDNDRNDSIPGIRGLSDNDAYGYEIDLSATYEATLSDRLTAKFVGGTVYADDDYMQTHFGVSAAQAAGSAARGVGLLEEDADAGFKNVYAKVSGVYQLTENFDMRAGLGYSRLLNDAADSQITEDENQFSGFLGAAYKLQF